MPRAGLAESTLQPPRAAVADEETATRFRAKIKLIPGSPCLWWSHAVSGRGHGRFWLGAVDSRDVVVIVHRFAWASVHEAVPAQTAASAAATMDRSASMTTVEAHGWEPATE